MTCQLLKNTIIIPSFHSPIVNCRILPEVLTVKAPVQFSEVICDLLLNRRMATWKLNLHTFLLTIFSCHMQDSSSKVVSWEHCHSKRIMAFPSNKTMLINPTFSTSTLPPVAIFPNVYHQCLSPVYCTSWLLSFHLSENVLGMSYSFNAFFFHEWHLIDCLSPPPPPQPPFQCCVLGKSTVTDRGLELKGRGGGGCLPPFCVFLFYTK